MDWRLFYAPIAHNTWLSTSGTIFNFAYIFVKYVSKKSPQSSKYCDALLDDRPRFKPQIRYQDHRLDIRYLANILKVKKKN